MLLAHRIRLDPTAAQREYFARAAGTTRRVWNRALAEWQRQRAAGGTPNAMALKKQFSAIKYHHPDWCDEQGQPWLRAMHRDSHAQPFTHLARAWSRCFDQLKRGQPAHPPRFRKKGRCLDTIYIANDKFRMDGRTAMLPKVGHVALREALRFDGKIMGATVQREADHWFISVQVEFTEGVAARKRTCDGVASGPLKAALRRLRIRSRRLSRKVEAARTAAGISGAIPKGTRLPVSHNRSKTSRTPARLHARIAASRQDCTHTLTTRLCRENQMIVIEDLNVKGMLANHRLARAIADIGFGRIRVQLAYKALRYGCRLVVASRWYASSKLCSTCGVNNAMLGLSERHWTCAYCSAYHDCDHNAGINLQRLAAGAAEDRSEHALPVAGPAVTPDPATGLLPAAGGKVTPVRDEHGQQDGSGQEDNAAHFCARSQ